jgi:hypothetical protein
MECGEKDVGMVMDMSKETSHAMITIGEVLRSIYTRLIANEDDLA